MSKNQEQKVFVSPMQELKSSVENSVASLFTKDDVLAILNFIEENTKNLETSYQKPIQEQIGQNILLTLSLKRHLQSALAIAVGELQGECVIDEANCEYHFRGREIFTTDMEIDRDYIETKIWDALQNAINLFQESL